MNKVEHAIRIATLAHEGQTDRDGEMYILHPLAVGLMGSTDEERCVGFLHDVVEDTAWTFDRLADEGFPQSVIGALQLLTHEAVTFATEEETLADYHAYVQRIIDSGNPVALAVKRNELLHNLSRTKAEDESYRRKYEPALMMVTEAMERRSKVHLYHPQAESQLAIFACGCFWGVQHMFARQKGVLHTLVGYTGGDEEYPKYDDVRSHATHHVEAVAVEYDHTLTDYKKLCQFFFEIHDPAQTDGQGPDKGEQYLSCIFYRDEEQKTIAQEVIADLRSRGYVVNTCLIPVQKFWVAEELHQDYYEKTGGEPYCHLREKKF